ncbi:HK97 gp10 family phage protein [Staphylococcus capitis]|uniref:HK97-gp10 family putative phage morphogenesis protein n=1 Tax=Staphylococcus capitis TaxID=29388 RepID=UPI00064AB19D|nr:HK97-gp10 family putative phage morphogenesis protein [Staphylococcus capitis]DAL54260.1 MAG TPA_asm: type I neck protein [Caudoviricetes sp.]AKL91481.1 phage protein, HK97 gp10 family [Staphylococcus capitis subsp. capitis]MCC0829304.1 hypothetical protein [Staphylococcus capitis]MCC3744471.1 hypothetical protein [Staphylococcus capitis]MCC9116525.1 hypothetical protein [Staphylococcus capitis]
MRFKSGGDLDDLIREFDRMNNTIDDNVDEVLHDNAVKFSTDTVKTAKEVMNKGYWTGNLARMVEDAKEGHLKYGITSKAGYSSFLEFGTRYMKPETFMFPVYQEFTKKVRADLERLING